MLRSVPALHAQTTTVPAWPTTPARATPAAPTRSGRRWAAVSVRYQQPVYGSVESAETGAIEQAEILGTAGRARDAEVLRVVQRLPAAGSPALLQGRPVRVHFVLPITFKIQ